MALPRNDKNIDRAIVQRTHKARKCDLRARASHGMAQTDYCPLPSAFWPLPSAFWPLASALCLLASALCLLASALCLLPSDY